MTGRILKYLVILILAIIVSIVGIFFIQFSILNNQETEFIADFDSNADETTSGNMLELEEEEKSTLNNRYWYLEALSDYAVTLTTTFDANNFYFEGHIKEVLSPPPRQLT